MKQKRDELVTSRTEKGEKIIGATREKQILPNLKEKYIAGPKDSIKPFAIHNTGDGSVSEWCT